MYTNKPTRNLMSVMAVVMAIMFIAVLAVGCGGGSSPTAPKPGPTPTPAPVATSISLTSTTPDCGVTIPRGGSVDVKVYVVVAPGDYGVGIQLLDASGNGLGGGVTGPFVSGTGFYNLTLKSAGQPQVSTSMALTLYAVDNPRVTLATQTSNCGFTWQ